MTPAAVRKYLSARAITSPWKLAGCTRADFAAAVVIPALAEGESLFATLKSLAASRAEPLARTLVLVVVNHREDAEAKLKAANRSDLARLAAGDGVPEGLALGWVDAASPGLELPGRDAGVGLARKIGFDLCLDRLDHGKAPFLVALDADTLVAPNYLEALFAHFETARQGGAVVPFCHRDGDTGAERRAIARYELFLRHYVLGLTLAGSPYAFHTVGSALACRAEAYARAGGMNRRAAGEDFYFLQQLAKTCGVAPVAATAVYPSARPSARTPFGTGRSVARQLAGEVDAVTFYHPDCYRLLGAWLSLVREGLDRKGEDLVAQAGGLSPALADYLETAGFVTAWRRLQDNHRTPQGLWGAFHGWFDGLKSLRLIHHLCAGPLPRIGAQQALPELLAWAGLRARQDVDGWLEALRLAQGAPGGA